MLNSAKRNSANTSSVLNSGDLQKGRMTSGFQHGVLSMAKVTSGNQQLRWAPNIPETFAFLSSEQKDIRLYEYYSSPAPGSEGASVFSWSFGHFFRKKRSNGGHFQALRDPCRGHSSMFRMVAVKENSAPFCRWSCVRTRCCLQFCSKLSRFDDRCSSADAKAVRTASSAAMQLCGMES